MYLASVFCLGLKAIVVPLNGQFCAKSEQVLWRVCCGCLGNVWGLIGGVCEMSERYLEGVLKVSDGCLLGKKMVYNC